ncbi:MAG: lipopolysaccharide biosynthesis protein [Pseudomonadota bacterium]
MVLRHSLLYLPAQVIGPAVQLIAMVAWTHLVDAHVVGVITLITAMHELLQVAFLAWWSQYALRFFSRHRGSEDPARFYRTENAILLSSIALQSLIAVAILLWIVAPDAGTPLIAATVLYVITRALSLYVSERARTSQQIGIYSVQQIVGPTAGFLLGWIMIKTIGPAPEYPLLGYAIAQAVAVIVVLPKLAYERGLLPADRETIRQALHYGLPLVIGGGLSWIGLNAPRFIVNDVLGVAAAGIFAVGYGLGQRASAMAAMLVTVAAYPIAVKSMEENGSAAAMRQLADNGALLLAVLAPATLGVFMLRHEIVTALIAEPFWAGTLAVLPLSVLAGGIRSVRAHFGDQVFLLHNRTRLHVVVSAADAIATLALGLLLTFYWGIVGAAIASIVAASIAAAVSIGLGLNLFRLQIPYLHIVRIAIACTAMGLLLSRLPEATSIPSLLLHIVAGAAVYCLALALTYSPWLLQRLRRRADIAPAE